MLKRLSDWRVRPVILAAFAGTLLLSGCDQITERIDRAKEVADKSAGQISGETIVDPSARNLETASTEDRALAGTVMAEFVVDDEERPMFAVGSIIAKPIDIPPDTAALSASDTELTSEDVEYFEDAYFEETAPAPDGLESLPPPAAAEAPGSGLEGAVRTEKVLPTITLDPRAASKTKQDVAQASKDFDQIVDDVPVLERRVQRMTKDEFKALPVEEKSEIRKLARRAPVNKEAVKAQLDANDVMLETMTKYKIGGQVALSRQGQMVIQIGGDGASPTQFRANGASPGEFLARADESQCTAAIRPEDVGDNLALATACVVRDLRASGQFEYVEPDFIFQNQFVRRTKDAPPPQGTGTKPGTSTTTTPGTGTTTPTTPASFNPNDPLWALQWHFRDRGTTDGRTAGGAGFETFWNRQGTTGSRSVVVAVVDTGLQMSHPDIAGSPNIMPGWDMVSDPRMGNDGDGRDSDANDPGDMCDPTKANAADSFHGTHVAGTVGAAATNNASGVAGGAWNVRIVPVRALGKCGGRLSDINDAIRWAAGIIPAEGPGETEVWNENPADIINLSIGLLGACPASLQDAIDAATERGTIVVSAAGNARMSTSFYAPAGCRGVVTVAASDARGQLTPYSNFGAEVMLLAPGGDLTRDDNGDGKPDGVLSTKASANCYDPVTGQSVANCFYAYEQGTSMAAPHVSAALALLKARAPTASRDELISTLQSALDPRQALQCSGLCSQYPGTTALPGNPDMCVRPCGTGLLNLAKVPALATGGGGR